MQGRRTGGRVQAIGDGNDACDLDLLLFFHRHPRVVLTSERLALYVGHDVSHVAHSLDTLITSGLLTRRQRPSATASMYVLALDGHATPPVDFEGFGILVVDDHEDTMDLYAAVLEQAGAIVQRATNLLEALNLFQQVRIGLVVTDIAMPGGSGWDVVRELRKHAPWVPFVAITGQLFPDGRELVDRGFAAALLKPIDPAELVAVVGHLIRQQRHVP